MHWHITMTGDAAVTVSFPARIDAAVSTRVVAVADAVRMNREIEHGIREMPEQYFWVHKRFKTRPPGEPDFYA